MEYQHSASFRNWASAFVLASALGLFALGSWMWLAHRPHSIYGEPEKYVQAVTHTVPIGKLPVGS